MFRTNQPVTSEGFFDRDGELEQLAELARRLQQGVPTWLAIIGPRKVGKTSMILELQRRAPELTFILLDVQGEAPLSLEIFRTYGLRVVDNLLGGDSLPSPPGSPPASPPASPPVSIEVAATNPEEYRSVLDESERFRALPREMRTFIRTLPEHDIDGRFIRTCLELPEQLATRSGVHVLVAIDEFQDLVQVSGKRGGVDPFPIMRSIWQKHQRVAYVVSGSGRTMLEEMVSQEHSPFFQHFSLMYVDRFTVEDAVDLLVRASPPDRPILEPLARRAVAAIGTHPFYVQLLGEAIVSRTPPYDERALKEALQDVVFSQHGRLSLYFRNLFDRAVGRSSYLAVMLHTLASEPRRLSDVARAIGIRTADAARYIQRLGDLVVRDEDRTYRLEDPIFALWLCWRAPDGKALPMSLVGDQAERETANVLARMGFDLVYQSLRSHGAFDLLATRGATQLGVQVKRRAQLPLRFTRSEWNRMQADAGRFTWRWVIAAVDPDGEVVFLDPKKARKGKEVRLAAAARIDNLLAWV